MGTFKNGLKGGVHIVKKEKVEEMAGISFSPYFLIAGNREHTSGTVSMYVFEPELLDVSFAGKMLGQILVTKQTGAEGKPVNKVKVYQFHLSSQHHIG